MFSISRPNADRVEFFPEDGRCLVVFFIAGGYDELWQTRVQARIRYRELIRLGYTRD